MASFVTEGMLPTSAHHFVQHCYLHPHFLLW